MTPLLALFAATALAGSYTSNHGSGTYDTRLYQEYAVNIFTADYDVTLTEASFHLSETSSWGITIDLYAWHYNTSSGTW